MDNNKFVENIEKVISRFIVGYENQIKDILLCLLADGHLLLEGVPGIAKTTLSKTLATTLDLNYSRIQFTQDLLPADIIGYYFYNKEANKFELKKGPIFTEFLLADEINRSSPKTQSALLEAMQEKQVTIEGSTFVLPDIFLVIATLNPIETEGVYTLPEAQIDRFMMKIKMNYPSKDEELKILTLKNDGLSSITKIHNREDIKNMRRDVQNIYTHPSMNAYIVDIARATRNIEYLELGLSPRGAIHLLKTSKTHAYLSGRSYVIPDDVKSVAHQTIDHRLIISPEAELESIRTESITDSILSTIPVPKEDFQTGDYNKE